MRGSTPCANSENMAFGGNTTCIQIKDSRSQDLLIVDCGTGFRNLGNQLSDHDHDLKGRIFITHPHWDHLQGFPFFKPFYEEKNTFRVYLPPQENVGCKEILQGHMSNTFFPVTIDMLNADMDCETFLPGKINFDGYSVDYMWAKHTIPTAMFKFNFEGKTIVFAPDNELPLDDSEESLNFIKEFQEFVRGADLLIHDAQFNREQHLSRQGWGHSCWESLIEATQGLDIGILKLTHHDPDSADSYLFRLESVIRAEYSAGYKDIGLAKEGQEIILPLE